MMQNTIYTQVRGQQNWSNAPGNTEQVAARRHHGGNNFNCSSWGGNLFSPQFLNTLLQLLQQLLNQYKPPQVNDREYRTFDGRGNNPQNPSLGAAGEYIKRDLKPDPSREPGGATEVALPGAREISNTVSAQQGNTANRKGLSDLFWMWGQFLDHDITLVESGPDSPKANIPVPAGDPYFDPTGTGTAEIGFTRSESFIDALGQARHQNHITAFIDGSNVYGSDKATADALRSFDGGKMKVSEGNLLPQDEQGNFVAGDIRANENAGLTSMHTLWVREHNRIADELGQRNPQWSDEQIFQEARRQVVAEIQAVTFNEFLPNLLGEGALGDYAGYDPNTNPQMSTAFSSAAFRFGHTMLSPNLLRLDENGQEIPEGNLSLRDAFFQPQNVKESGIDALLRGGASQTAQAVDPMLIDDVRNFLFGPPGAGGFDLAALNIQRGRDQGLPGYNDARTQMGLPRIESFDDPIWQDGVGEKLAQLYRSPDDVDLWVAGLAEKHTGDSLLGETSTAILTAQFEALRNGDRFWYENQYSGKDLNYLNNLKLSDIIRSNTDVNNIQDDVMIASNIHLTQPTVRSMSMPAAATGNTALDNTPVIDGAIRQLQQAINAGHLG